VAPRGIYKENFGAPLPQDQQQQVIDWVLAHYPIDRDRIYGIGFSMGGGGVASYAARHLDRTGAMFAAMTAYVFITKKDFSFLRSALTIAGFAFLGIILASMLFGFSLGGIFAGFGILLMAGYILYYTSVVMKDFPPTAYVAAALMLFSTIATLFWYVLQLLMSLRGND